MNTQTSNSFNSASQSTGPWAIAMQVPQQGSRDSGCDEDEDGARKAQNNHKRVISKARLARNKYSELETINVGDATINDLVDDYAILEESRRQDMEDEY